MSCETPWTSTYDPLSSSSCPLTPFARPHSSLPSDPLAALAHYKQLCSSLQDKLQSAEDDINDFSESSKELQRELEKELETMEMAERGLRREMETERGRADEWKVRRLFSRIAEEAMRRLSCGSSKGKPRSRTCQECGSSSDP